MIIKDYWKTFSSSVFNPNGSTTSDQVPLVLVNEHSDIKVKTITPNYQELIRSGAILPVNPYSRTIKNVGHMSFSLSSSILGTEWYREVFISEGLLSIENTPHFTTIASLLSSYASQINVLDQDAKAKLNDHVSNVIVDVPVELGELKETANLLVNTVQSMANFALDWKRKTGQLRRNILNILSKPGGNRNQRRALLKQYASELNGKYLEYTYGWNPLMSTFGSISDLLKEHIEGARPRKKMSGKATYKDVLYGETFLHNSNTSQLPSIYLRKRTLLTIDVWFGGLLIEDEVNSRVSLNRELGLTVGNVVPAIWELTRLSFIADYFTNIGNVIGNLRAAPSRLQAATLYRSVKIVAKTDHEVVAIKHLNVQNNYIKTDNVTLGDNIPSELIYFNRTPVTTAGLLVTPIARVPSWDHVFKSLSVAAAVTRVFK
jgi:hypothetical protein